jgi:hypothetical protein
MRSTATWSNNDGFEGHNNAGPAVTRTRYGEQMNISYSASSAVPSRAKQQQYKMRRVGFREPTDQ